MNDIGKVPPQAVDIEETVIATLLMEEDSRYKVMHTMSMSDFYKHEHSILFKHIKKMYSNSEQIDILTICENLEKSGEIDTVGGHYGVTLYTNKVGYGGGSIVNWCRIIKEKSAQRKLIRIGQELINKAYGNDLDTSLGFLRKSTVDVLKFFDTSVIDDFKTVLKDTADEIKENCDKRAEGITTGIMTGLSRLDSETGGWQDTSLYIIGARPAMGKTSLLIKFIEEAARQDSNNVLVFSLEMSKRQLATKIIGKCGISPTRMQLGNIDQREFIRIETEIGKLENLNIFIEDDAGMTIDRLEAVADKMHIEEGLDAIYIDYLQLIVNTVSTNPTQSIGDTSRRLKVLAKRLNVPVICLSQLSRGLEQRPDKRPIMSDLRDSGSIEQDADSIFFIYREGYYDKENDERIIEFDNAKNRHGSTNTYRIVHNEYFTQFEDEEYFPDVPEDDGVDAITESLMKPNEKF